MDHRYNENDDDFVRDVEEESLEHDVERQIDQTIAAYNRKKDKDTYDYFPDASNKQKDVSKNRIESAKPNIGGKRDMPQRYAESANAEASRRKGQQTKKEMFYERFSDYVKQNHITPEDFWNASKEKLSSDEFRECLDTIGFNYGKEEFEDVIFDITDANFFVTLPALCSKIKNWENYSADKTLEALKDNVLKIAQESRKKLTSAESAKTGLHVRPQSGALYSPSGALLPASARPFSGISMISSKSKNTMGTTQNDYNRLMSADTFKRTTTSYENKSAKYLKDAKKREAKKDQILALTISKAKNEFEYSCLAKMGEANEISQSLGETITYRAYNSADGHLKCHVYNYDKLVAELSMKDFIREYKALKQKQFQKQNLKIWEVLNQDKGGASNYYFSSNKAEHENAGDDNQRRNIAKKDRQKELKAVLFETMKLTNTLKSQLEKLEKSGLVYEAQPPKY